ncbi:50S ribosomal protein L9 [Novispirillum sp. DQ9]|uniref:50S ribosomal protein L9 n=1 Tax=Novispirillum sp. DQ9 TaxID=3398612 RepID=UPI003C7A9752
MEVILLERIEKLGQMGDTVKVKPGYARNYLLPQKKALRANKANMAFFEAQRAELEAVNLKRRQEAEAVAEKMKDVSLILVRQAAESGQLYGSVAARDLQEALKDNGYKIERRQVLLDAPIKSLGRYDIRLGLHPEVIVTIGVTVARSVEEAEAQHRAAEFLESEEDAEEAEAYEAEAEEALHEDDEE